MRLSPVQKNRHITVLLARMSKNYFLLALAFVTAGKKDEKATWCV